MGQGGDAPPEGEHDPDVTPDVADTGPAITAAGDPNHYSQDPLDPTDIAHNYSWVFFESMNGGHEVYMVDRYQDPNA